jgi:hypothetical protein
MLLAVISFRQTSTLLFTASPLQRRGVVTAQVDKTNPFFAAAVTAVLDACLQPRDPRQDASGPGGGIDRWDNVWLTGEREQQALDAQRHKQLAAARASAAKERANSGTAVGGESTPRDRDHPRHRGGTRSSSECDAKPPRQTVHFLDPRVLFAASVGPATNLAAALKLFRACSPHEVRMRARCPA